MWRCPYCETHNEDTDDFCMICGNGRNASAGPETGEENAAAVTVQAHVPEPAPAPRPSKVWDNGDGIGGAVDLKALAAKRAADRSERERTDAEIRDKLAGRKPDYEAEEKSSGMHEKPEGAPKRDTDEIVYAVMIYISFILTLALFWFFSYYFGS